MRTFSLHRLRLQSLAVAFALLGLFCGIQGTWIFGKAIVAQVLLQSAWHQTRDGVEQARPWPWADTWPVARLRAPRQAKDLIVLAGATGEAMAFGPGHLSNTALPGAIGNSVITAHRDTHFSFLRELAVGDWLWVETPDGAQHRYRVANVDIVDKSNTEALQEADAQILTLVTCYPFDAVVPGGPLRYVVQAIAEPASNPPATRS